MTSVIMYFDSDEQGWKTKLKMPPKDNRKQTTVSLLLLLLLSKYY